MDAKLKHLEMIQAVITRMAHNSFLLKGWTAEQDSRVRTAHQFVTWGYGSPFVISNKYKGRENNRGRLEPPLFRTISQHKAIRCSDLSGKIRTFSLMPFIPL